jgi:hypothetical protein
MPLVPPRTLSTRDDRAFGAPVIDSVFGALSCNSCSIWNELGAARDSSIAARVFMSAQWRPRSFRPIKGSWSPVNLFFTDLKTETI